MNKNEAINIITKAAALYEEHFRDKNYLIVYGNKNNGIIFSSLSFYETIAFKRNFAHLTEMTLAISQ